VKKIRVTGRVRRHSGDSDTASDLPRTVNRARVNGSEIDAGFLLPPAQTWAGVDAAADHVASYRAAATLPFLIETGVNYLRPRPGELSDGAFIAAVADRGDCALPRVIEGGRPHGVWRSGRDYPAGELGRPARRRTRYGPPPSPAPDVRATQEWERRIAAYTSRIMDNPPTADPGLGLLRHLADQARLGQLVLARPDLIRSLVATIGLDRTEEMLHRYLRARPPQRWTAREGEQFASWLAEDAPGVSITDTTLNATGAAGAPA
jgi:hypothetical protein